MADTGNPFDRGVLDFLKGIAAHNTRAWFDKNKERYEAQVREPALEFIRAMAPHVAKISPHLVASDRKVGGSLMRIHRDTRFSRDKAPYKTNLGIQFRHDAGKDVHAPGLYFHVEPGMCFLGAGMWRPHKDALAAVRRAIDEDPKGWKRVRDRKSFRDLWKLSGDSLKRAPKGYPEDHPMIEDLRRTDHIVVCEVPLSEITAPGLVRNAAARYAKAKEFLSWQAEALGIPF